MATKIPRKSQNRGNEVGKIMQANLLLSQCMRSSFDMSFLIIYSFATHQRVRI